MYEKISFFTENDLYFKYIAGVDLPSINKEKVLKNIISFYEKNYKDLIGTDKALSFYGDFKVNEITYLLDGLFKFFPSIKSKELVVDYKDFSKEKIFAVAQIFEFINLIINEKKFDDIVEQLLFDISVIRSEKKTYAVTLIINKDNILSLRETIEKTSSFGCNINGFIDVYSYSQLEKEEIVVEIAKLINILNEIKQDLNWPVGKSIEELIPSPPQLFSPSDVFMLPDGEITDFKMSKEDWEEFSCNNMITKILIETILKEASK